MIPVPLMGRTIRPVEPNGASRRQRGCGRNHTRPARSTVPLGHFRFPELLLSIVQALICSPNSPLSGSMYPVKITFCFPAGFRMSRSFGPEDVSGFSRPDYPNRIHGSVGSPIRQAAPVAADHL